MIEDVMLLLRKGVRSMLETCDLTAVQHLAQATGKTVENACLDHLPLHSLLKVVTRSGNIYIIETSGADPCTHEHGVHVARISPRIGAMVGYLGIRHIRDSWIRTQKRLQYHSSTRIFRTSKVVNIQIFSC